MGSEPSSSIEANTGPESPVFPPVGAVPAPPPPTAPAAAKTGVSGVVSGAGFLGIVTLDTRFPRLPGDLGRPDAWPVPARAAAVHGAWPDKVVASGASLRANRLVAPFVNLARQLERAGAWAITTSCGFLVLLQKEMQAAVRVPVVTSGLLLLPALLARERRVGVLTLSAARLGHEHLRAAGVPRERLADVLVQGLPADGAFVRAILGNQPQLDADAARAEAVAAARSLQQRAPDLTTLVLECTNLPPHAEAIAAATGWRVLSLRDSTALRAPWTRSRP